MNPAISISHLYKRFRIRRNKSGPFSIVKRFLQDDGDILEAVCDLSFEINPGELIGFIGPNGAGKTTTLKCLSGLIHPSEGILSVLGFEPYKRKKEFLSQISFVTGQRHQLWWDLPAGDTLSLMKEIYALDDSAYKKTLTELLDLLSAHDILTQQVRTLSLGQRMKLELIVSLIHRPKVLFMDEPTLGLDVVMQRQVQNYIAQLNKRFGITVLLTSHYMQDVRRLCKRIIMIDKGHKMYDGAIQNLLDTKVRYKIFTLRTRSDLDEKTLKSWGKILVKETDRCILEVPISTSQKVARQMLDSTAISDFSMEEPELDDIIREIFHKRRI